MQFLYYNKEYNVTEKINSLSRKKNLLFIYKKLVLIRILAWDREDLR